MQNLNIPMGNIKRHCCFGLMYAAQFMGCHLNNSSLAIHSQQKRHNDGAMHTEKREAINQEEQSLFFFDFFPTLFKDGLSADEIEDRLFPTDKTTLSISDTTVCALTSLKKSNVCGDMFGRILKLWTQSLVIDPDLCTKPFATISNLVALCKDVLHADPAVKSFLETNENLLCDHEKLKRFIVCLLNNNYKVFFYAFLKHPCIIPLMLTHIGLTETQINTIHIVYANNQLQKYPNHDEIMWRTLQKVLYGTKADCQFVLGDLLYTYASKHQGLLNRLDHNQLHIAMAMPENKAMVSFWEHLEDIITTLYDLIKRQKRHSGIDPKSAKSANFLHDQLIFQLQKMAIAPYQIIENSISCWL